MILNCWRGIQVGIFIVAIAVLGSGCNMSDLSGQVWKAIDDGDVTSIEQLSKNNKAVLSKVRLDGDTPLLYAMKKGEKECFEALLKCGADPNQIVGRNGKAAPNYAAADRDSYYLRTLLLYGGNPNLDNQSHPRFRGSPLLFAIQNNHIENAKLLIAAGADVDLKIESQHCPLTEAAATDAFEIVIVLIDSGADIQVHEKGRMSFAYLMHQKRPDLYTHPPTRDACQKVWDKLKEMGVDPEKAHWEGEYFVW